MVSIPAVFPIKLPFVVFIAPTVGSDTDHVPPSVLSKNVVVPLVHIADVPP